MGRPQQAPHGIISACAEQTHIEGKVQACPWDHLRVCGADLTGKVTIAPVGGSSPRVRSRLPRPACEVEHARIISACAEQTACGARSTFVATDHLRVCGADRSPSYPHTGRMGSSPRVRSRPGRVSLRRANMRIISACAEQTSGGPRPGSRTRNHLRVCGADLPLGTLTFHQSGSSPRVRSRPPNWRGHAHGIRIISACAEQT